MSGKENGATRLLIVDDVELNRALLGEMFRSNYVISEAENGRVALDVLEKQHEEVAAVLLDIIMPELDGFGVLREMTARGWIGRIPVVMITAETSDSVLQKGYEMGAADIISKPFNPSIVRQRIYNVVEQYNYRRNLERLVHEQTEALRQQAQELRENSIQLIDILSTLIEFKNTESVQHIYHIRIITKLLLTELARTHTEYGLTEEIIEASSEAAAMHDIGKIAIPDQILNKPGRLTAEEFEIMKTHTVRGCEVLEKISAVRNLFYYDYCYEICRHHHERWDGRGYPDGLVGNQTPIWAQAVSLADAYDALISKRVYKDAFASERAVQMILDGECGVFNPVLVECFLKIVPDINRCASDQEPLRRQSVREMPAIPRPEPALSSRTLRLLEMERQKYRILSELSGEILFDYDMQTDCLTFSEQYQIQTGKNLEVRDLRKKLKNGEILEPDAARRLLDRLHAATPENPACKLQLRINLDGDGLQWYEVYLYPIWEKEDTPKCVSCIGKLINIERQKQERMQLQHAADTDPLTDIWNRKAMHKGVVGLLEDPTLRSGAMCFIDLDNFKQVNDSRGHAVGDEILRRVAGMMHDGIRNGDLIGRIGGDEFLIFFRDINPKTFAQRVDSIRLKMRENLGGYGISASVGIALYPKDGMDYETLLNKADQALYYAKQRKDRCEFYSAKCQAMAFCSLLSGVDAPSRGEDAEP